MLRASQKSRPTRAVPVTLSFRQIRTGGALTIPTVFFLPSPAGRAFLGLQSFALADQGRGSEHDDRRDECRHKGIQHDFIQNFGHCILPVAGSPAPEL